MRRSDRDRISCTLTRLRPVTSAISGPLRSPPNRSATISRSRGPRHPRARSRSGSSPRSGTSAGATRATCPPSSYVERSLTGPAVRSKVVDEQVAGDDEQPRADLRAGGVVARPRLERPLERLLRQILRVGAATGAVREEPVHLPYMLVVDGGEIAGSHQYERPRYCTQRRRRRPGEWPRPQTARLYPPVRRERFP
jgi:hypothetical protein